jgi:hypothetical protein
MGNLADIDEELERERLKGIPGKKKLATLTEREGKC